MLVAALESLGCKGCHTPRLQVIWHGKFGSNDRQDIARLSHSLLALLVSTRLAGPMQPCVRSSYKCYDLSGAKLKNAPPKGLGEYFELGLISALGAAVQRTAASSEQSAEVPGTAKKN